MLTITPSTSPRSQNGSTAARRPPLLRVLVVHGLVIALWLAAFLGARLLEYAPHASLWFPPAGISLAAFLVLGLRALPSLWLACVGATLIAELTYAQQLGPGELLASSLLFALAHTTAYGAAAAALHRLSRGRLRYEATLRAVTAFLLLGAVGAALAALLGAYSLSISGMIAAATVPGLLVPWWIGDYAGLLAVTPLASLLLMRVCEYAGLRVETEMPRFVNRIPRNASAGRFSAKLTLLLGLSCAILLAYAQFPEQKPLIFTLFIAVVVQLWIVHTEGPIPSIIGVFAFSLLMALASAVLGLGADALVLQFALITLAANSYFGLALPAIYADNQRLRQLLTHDSLTGATSRAFFEERVQEGVETVRRRGESAALLMIDLDRLKAINDEFGHAAGDSALCRVKELCSACLRPEDVFGRLSGDEFAAFLPRTDVQTAQAVVERMRSALSGHTDDGPPLRASFGLAVATPQDTYDSLLARADAAMYEDKRQGRTTTG